MIIFCFQPIQERQKYQQEKLERESNELDRIRELETIIVEKEDLVVKVKQRAQQEITELNELLDENKRFAGLIDFYDAFSCSAYVRYCCDFHISRLAFVKACCLSTALDVGTV